MSILDENNRSLSVAEANEIAIRESEGRLHFAEEGGEVFAIHRSEPADDAESPQAGIPLDQSAGAFERRVAMSRLAVTAWGVFEMARAAGPRPERMVHGRASRSVAPQRV